MYSFLPDELLKEILAPALQVPDDSFTCTAGRSPFSNYNPTTSGYLLVCKDWLRVATPLLYSVVVLRSKAQIQALESALLTTPILAEFIKKLRIESGYCNSLLKILADARNLTDLCLSFEIYSRDTVAGLCRGLAQVQPTRLITYDPRPYRHGKPINQNIRELFESIRTFIPKWERLRVVRLPWIVEPVWSGSESGPKPKDLIDAICQSKSVEVVAILSPWSPPRWLNDLAKLPSLKKIVVGNRRSVLSSEYGRVLKDNPKLQELLEFLPEIQKQQLPVKTVSAPPKIIALTTKGISTFPDKVWTNILFYVLDLPELEQKSLSIPQDLPPSSRGHRQLLLVCRKFHDLAKPLSYRNIIVPYDMVLNRGFNLFSLNREAALQVRSLFCYVTKLRDMNSSLLHGMLLQLPNLQRLKAKPTEIFGYEGLSTLAEKSGPRLLEMSIQLSRPGTPQSPKLFYQFTSLKYLDIDTSAVFLYESVRIRKDGLPNLESIKCVVTHGSLLVFLSGSDLSGLREARFPSFEKCEGAITLLRKHGHKLRFLECGFLPGVCVFDACPNLTTFEMPYENPGHPTAEFFYSSADHPLESLHIKTVEVKRGAEKFRYLGELDLSKFTLLRQIHVNTCPWPTTESEIKKSQWVVWAERLQRLYKVDIVDSKGHRWRPRLREKR